MDNIVVIFSTRRGDKKITCGRKRSVLLLLLYSSLFQKSPAWNYLIPEDNINYRRQLDKFSAKDFLRIRIFSTPAVRVPVAIKRKLITTISSSALTNWHSKKLGENLNCFSLEISQARSASRPQILHKKHSPGGT
jgi:hypothetical protein